MLRSTFFSFVFLVLSAVGVQAQTSITQSCPIEKARQVLPYLCNSISTKGKDSDPDSDYVWVYQRLVYEGSCVDFANDSKSAIREKVNLFWNHASKVGCDASDFDVQNGNLLKYAFKKKFRDFIIDAAQVWQLEPRFINQVDASDRKNTLDYARDEINKNVGGAFEGELRVYYRTLRNAGAAHSVEFR